MATPFDNWFVQLGLGVFLGPMSLADVRQLAESGALLETDRIRHSGTDNWLLASEVPGIFTPAPDEWLSLPDETSLPPLEPADDEVTQPTTAFAAVDDDDNDDESITLAPLDNEQSLTPIKKARRQAGKADSIRAKDVLKDAPDASDATTVRRPVALARPYVGEIPPAPVPATNDFEVGFLKPTLPEPRKPQSDPVIDLGVDQPIAIPEQVAPSTVTSPVPTATPPEEAQRAAVPSVRPVPAFVPPVKPVTRRTDRTSANWIKPALIGTTLLGVLALIWAIWPSSEPNIYAQYRVLYEDLQRFHDGTANGKWDDFVQRTRETTAATIPWLEKNAKPGDRDKDLLLYVGRDLQAAIELAPDAEFRHQARLDGFMSQLRESFESQ